MKKIISITTCLLLILSFSANVFAADLAYPDAPRVVDLADAFTPEEEHALELLAREIIDNYNIDFVIYTNDDNQGKTLEQGADDFYVENNYGAGDSKSGSLVYICFDPEIRAWYTSTCGESIKFFDYDNINIIDDAIEPYMLDGDFFEAMRVCAAYTNELYGHGCLYDYNNEVYYAGPKSGWTKFETSPYYEKHEGHKDTNLLGPIFAILSIAILIGAFSGVITRSKALKSMQTIEDATNAEAYTAKGSFKLTHSENIFLTMAVSRTPRVQDPPPSHNGSGTFHSGGSSFSGGHFSSGGSFHSGGGGRHF